MPLSSPASNPNKRIREAYRSKLVSVNPEDNPEGFKRLREAYERALSLARQQEETENEADPDSPVSLFLKEAEPPRISIP